MVNSLWQPSKGEWILTGVIPTFVEYSNRLLYYVLNVIHKLSIISMINSKIYALYLALIMPYIFRYSYFVNSCISENTVRQSL